MEHGSQRQEERGGDISLAKDSPRQLTDPDIRNSREETVQNFGSPDPPVTLYDPDQGLPKASKWVRSR